MLLLENPVRRYAWGSVTAIPDLLGTPPDGEPQAELWLGAHPGAPSRVVGGEHLDRVIAGRAEEVLGDLVVRRFGPRLPYLLKVLAADAPLSLQVHPDEAQAQEGFDAENHRGVATDAATRRYPDCYHKPEMVVALTRFEALCGLRHPDDVLELTGSLDVRHTDWPALVECLHEDGGLRSVFEGLLSARETSGELVAAVTSACTRRLRDGSSHDVEDSTVVELAAAYPGDPGVVLSLLLNRVTLEPGEALYLPAGNLHAYLRGTAIEIMACSDNVLRAGLTPKHVDVDELMRVVDFRPVAVPHVVPETEGAVAAYRAGAAEFELLQVCLDGGSVALREGGPRVLLGLDGELQVQVTGQTAALPRGSSVLVTDADGALRLAGTGAAVIARVPGA